MDKGEIIAVTRNVLVPVGLAATVMAGAIGCGGEGGRDGGGDRICNTLVDSDCDGTPNLNEGPDLNRNGVPDRLEPNISPGVTTTTVTKRLPGVSTTLYIPCNLQRGPDADGDGLPNQCDSVYNDNSRDSDRDGLPDTRDPCPQTYDCDNDGLPDGSDPEPRVSRRTESSRQQQRREDDRLERERLERERQERQRQESRRNDPLYGDR